MVKQSPLPQSQYNALRAIASEWYMDIPKQVEIAPLKELLDTSCVRIFEHGYWRWCYEGGIIYYRILQ